MEAVLSSRLFKQPTLVRLMMGIALVILPGVAWIDFRQGHHFAMAVELAAAFALLTMIFLIRPLGVARSKRITLVIVFFLALLASVEKLDSTAGFAWFTVMPFLYISIGGIRLGGFLAVSHFLVIAVLYLRFAQGMITELETSAWLQISLAYVTAAGLAISNEHVQRQLRNRLHSLADHDPLTGLLNRRGMEKRLKQMDSFLRRHKVPVTLALLDIDHFKKVNDEHGHDAGDTVLRELSDELTRIFRDSDYIARWGGEEFLVALTNTDLAAATEVLERLRSEISSSSAFSGPSITLSMGAARWHANEPLSEALKQADVALYDAKDNGRNALVPADPSRRLASAVSA
jgi:diguanylate cyclase (GGDEF)-like protein